MSTNKITFWTRFRRWFSAEANAALDRREDPAKMLDELLREYDNKAKDAESNVATVIGNLRLMEAEHAEKLRDAEKWGLKAAQAADRAERTSDPAERERMAGLARTAIERQIVAEESAASYEPQIAAHTQQVEQLKAALLVINDKRSELRAKRDELVTRDRVAAAQETMVDAVRSVDADDATGEMRRIEEKVKRREAQARGKAELAASTAEAQFRNLDALDRNLEVDARLAALKTGAKPQLRAVDDRGDA